VLENLGGNELILNMTVAHGKKSSEKGLGNRALGKTHNMIYIIPRCRYVILSQTVIIPFIPFYFFFHSFLFQFEFAFKLVTAKLPL
jgi:hypothetical protein